MKKNEDWKIIQGTASKNFSLNGFVSFGEKKFSLSSRWMLKPQCLLIYGCF